MYLLGQPTAKLVCLGDGKDGIHPSFDVDAQGAACPAGPRVGVAYAVEPCGDAFGRDDHVVVDPVE